MLTGITWILVADPFRGRLFRLSEASGLEELRIYVCAEGRMQGQQVGEVSHEGSSGRDAIEPSIQTLEKRSGRFADCLQDILARGLNQRHFQQLVLVAPPHFLGVLRDALNESVREAVVAELAKDLVDADRRTVLATLPRVLRTGARGPGVSPTDIVPVNFDYAGPPRPSQW